MSRRGKTPPPAAASLGGPLPEKGRGIREDGATDFLAPGAGVLKR